ncbi:MAG: PLDc N-terminal domain-containing protein [Chloroflexota bacterium]|nr:PLDc N-terminal domain-containing protein [Chloroflexota bacterium]
MEVVGPGGFEAMFGSFFLIAILLSAVFFVGLIAALVSIFQRTDEQVVGDSRVLWALVVLFVPFGFLAYFLVGRR